MSFELQLDDADQDYLDNLPLSPTAKKRMDEFIEYGLIHIKDSVRTNPDNRPYPGKLLFKQEFIILDFWGDKRWHKIQFTVDDSKASVGKLLVVFLDHIDSDCNW